MFPSCPTRQEVKQSISPSTCRGQIYHFSLFKFTKLTVITYQEWVTYHTWQCCDNLPGMSNLSYMAMLWPQKPLYCSGSWAKLRVVSGKRNSRCLNWGGCSTLWSIPLVSLTLSSSVRSTKPVSKGCSMESGNTSLGLDKLDWQHIPGIRQVRLATHLWDKTN